MKISAKTTRIFLICGIIATLFYIAIDAIAAMQYPGYNYLDQAISELSAIGAPTARLWLSIAFFYNPLVILFGIGVLQAAGSRRSMRITGVLISIWAATGFLWVFFPMNMRGTNGSFSDTMHLVMSAETVLFLTAFMITGSGANGKWFRFYSIIAIIAMLSLGAVMGYYVPKVAANQPTPLMGIAERVMVFSPMVWMLVLSVILLREQAFAGKEQTSQ